MTFLRLVTCQSQTRCRRTQANGFAAVQQALLLAYVTGSVAEELLARNVDPVTENRILRHQIQGRIRFTDPERTSLASASK